MDAIHFITDPGSAFAGGPWLPFREGVAFASSVAFQRQLRKMHEKMVKRWLWISTKPII